MHRPTDPAQSQLSAKLQQAVALHQRGQLSRAQRLYEEILSEQPRNFDALHLLGVIAAVTGDPKKAVDLIGRAIEINPNGEATHNNRGAALQQLGDWQAAVAEFDRAIELRKDYAEPHYNRANVLKDQKQWEAALAGYGRALALKPDYPDAWSNRGIVLAELHQREAALASYDRAIWLKNDFPQAHFNRANVLCQLRRWDAALAGYDRAISLKGDYAEAYCNRGFALHELRRLDEALASCNRAIEINPQYAEAYCNRGILLQATKRLDEALASYDRAVALKTDYASGYVSRAMGLLLAGEYARGWADYEWRWQDGNSWIVNEKRNFAQPLWLGQEPLSGKTIFLQSEQGYGDTIQFCRYVKPVSDLGARVILEVQKPLSTLLQNLDGLAQLVVPGETLPAFDYYCPLMSLPLAMGTTLSNVPARVPYIAISDERRRLWRQKVGGAARAAGRFGLVRGLSARSTGIMVGQRAPERSVGKVRNLGPSQRRVLQLTAGATRDLGACGVDGASLGWAASEGLDQRDPRLRGYRGVDRAAGFGDFGGYLDGALGRRFGQAGVDPESLRRLLALAAGSRRQPLVSDRSALPPRSARGLGQRAGASPMRFVAVGCNLPSVKRLCRALHSR